MEIFLLVGLMTLAVLLTIWGYFFVSRQKDQQTAVSLLKQDLQSLEQTLQQFAQGLSQRLDSSQERVNASLRSQLETSSKLIADVSDNLRKLSETNSQVISIASELKGLQAVLANPKHRGVFGEFQLENILRNVLPPGGFQMQYHFRNASIVDAVIFLDGKILPVDAKFSLENYQRILAAANKQESKLYQQKLVADLKKRIEETSKYILPAENTMEFALMFIPSESLYYDLLDGKLASGSSLLEYAFVQKKVIIVSPTTFMAYLQTIVQGLRSLQIEKQAREIQTKVQQLGQHLDKFAVYLHKLGNALTTTVNHFNAAGKQFVSIDRDIVKISGGSSKAVAEILDKPQNLLD